MALLPAGCAPAAQAPEGVTRLFNGRDLAGWKVLSEDFFDRAGKVHVKDGRLHLEAGRDQTGIAWQGDFPQDEYEVCLEAMRVEGGDFFCGMTFPVGGSRATLIVGGWGGSVVGISNVDDFAADENETTKTMEFEQNRWYGIRLRIADGKVQAWIDEEKVIDLATAGRRFNVWMQQDSVKPFGVATWCTGAAIRDFTLRRF